MKKKNNTKNFSFYQEEELLPKNPQIAAFSFERTPTESSGRNPCADGNNLW